jgi:hypothetical protein
MLLVKGVALTKASLQLHLTSRNGLAGTAVAYTCDLQAENCINPVGKRSEPSKHCPGLPSRAQ